jgi:hypothetical protein
MIIISPSHININDNNTNNGNDNNNAPNNNLYNIVAGHILNYEYAKSYFTDGKFIKSPKYNTFPQFTYQNIQYDIKSHITYLYLPEHLISSEFVADVITSLDILEAELRKELNLGDIPETFETIDVGTNCYTSQSAIKYNGSYIVERLNNDTYAKLRRIFAFNHPANYDAKSQIVICLLDNGLHEIAERNIALCIPSILFDANNSIRKPQNITTQSFALDWLLPANFYNFDNLMLEDIPPPFARYSTAQTATSATSTTTSTQDDEMQFITFSYPEQISQNLSLDYVKMLMLTYMTNQMYMENRKTFPYSFRQLDRNKSFKIYAMQSRFNKLNNIEMIDVDNIYMISNINSFKKTKHNEPYFTHLVKKEEQSKYLTYCHCCFGKLFDVAFIRLDANILMCYMCATLIGELTDKDMPNVVKIRIAETLENILAEKDISPERKSIILDIHHTKECKKTPFGYEYDNYFGAYNLNTYLFNPQPHNKKTFILKKC